MLLPCACQPVNSAPLGDGGGADVVDFMPTYSCAITGPCAVRTMLAVVLRVTLTLPA